MIPYVYKWTHLPSLKWYVGVRTAKGCHPNDGYICSSKVVKPMILQNPKQWIKTIVATGTVEDMVNLEYEILDLTDAIHDSRSFNMRNGPFSGIAGKYKTEEHKEKLRLLNIGKKHRPDSIEKMKQKRKFQTNFKGKGFTWSEEAKQRNRGKPKIRLSCINCKSECSINLFDRWHLKCKAER
jgi:hypothetical protein